MPLLNVSVVTKLYGALSVLNGVSFSLEKGEHVALVGSNGTGKSTLLKIIAGLLESDSGQVSLAQNAIVTYVAQEAEFPTGQTLWDAMLDIFSSRLRAQRRMRELEALMSGDHASAKDVAEYRQVSGVAEHGDYDHESQIERVLEGLDLHRDLWQSPVAHLSGGQRTRANLARALLTDSDLVLLDEPTNHLDIPAIEWLETYLRSLQRAFIVIAHDRYFLDRVTNRTLELAFGKIHDYGAPYSKFLELRQAARARAEKEFLKQQEQIRKTEEFIQKYGAGQRYKEARGRQKRLDRLERLEEPRDERRLKMNLKRPTRTGDVALQIQGLKAGYGDRVLVRCPDELTILRGSRVALVGPNGSGKTTLARTLIGQIPAMGGSLRWAPNTEIGYYAQSSTGELDRGKTVLETLQDRCGVGEDAARDYLARFLFQRAEVLKQVQELSGGEQSRLALACLLYSQPNVLLLDEPTNHLDIPSREALEDAIRSFNGTLLVISHDRFLIEAIATETWTVQNSRLQIFDGSWSDLLAGRHARALTYSDTEDSPVPVTASHPLDRDWERRLDLVQLEAVQTAQRLSNLAQSGTPKSIEELTDAYERLQKELETLTEQWLAQT